MFNMSRSSYIETRANDVGNITIMKGDLEYEVGGERWWKEKCHEIQ